MTIKPEIDLESWVEKLKETLELLDLIVFLPIEYHDKIPLPPSENRKLRLRVNENLQGILLDDDLMILKHTKVLEVTGSLEKRVNTILQTVGKT